MRRLYIVNRCIHARKCYRSECFSGWKFNRKTWQLSLCFHFHILVYTYIHICILLPNLIQFARHLYFNGVNVYVRFGGSFFVGLLLYMYTCIHTALRFQHNKEYFDWCLQPAGLLALTR